MTPTKEMIAMAERIADRLARDPMLPISLWKMAYNAALAAIMEERERIAEYIATGPNPPFTHGPPVTRDAFCADLANAIRNGEHLR